MTSAAPVYISAEKVDELLDWRELLNSLEVAMGNFSRGGEGGIVQPVRSVVPVTDHKGFLLSMPAYSQPDQALAQKIVSLYPNNTDVPAHQGIVLLFDETNGSLKAMLDAEEITKIRTGVASAVATKHLAYPNSKILAVIGSGVQAHSHIKALSLLHTFEEVRIYSRSAVKREKLAAEVGGQPCVSAEEAVRGADIIVTATFSTEPIVMREWVKEGAHINAVGACVPTSQELDPDLMNEAVVYVDTREGAEKESGDVIKSRAKIYAEIGEVIIGKKEAFPSKTTVFKSLGMAIEDVISAKLVYNEYMKKQVGSKV